MALSVPCGVLKEYRRKRLNFSRGIQLRKNESGGIKIQSNSSNME